MATNSVTIYKGGRSRTVQQRELDSFLNDGWSTRKPAVQPETPVNPFAGVGGTLTNDDITEAFDARKDPNKNLSLESLRTQVGAMVPSWVPSSWITDFTTIWANDYERTRPGQAIPSTVQGFADYSPGFMSGLQWLPIQVAAAKNGTSLPPVFLYRSEDGSESMYSSSLKRGATPLNTAERRIATGRDLGPLSTDPVDMRTFPRLDDNILQSLITSVSGGGGGGGGGGGRQDIPFDRDKMIEDATNLWRKVLLEPPADIGRVVDKYMTEANAFWIKSGGSKDFETFLWDQMRATPRHKQLYRWKPEELHEQDFMNQYTGRVAAFGLRPDRQTEQLERSLTSGGSPAGQSERIGRSREVVVGNQGTFSKGFANTLASLGPAAWRG